MPGIRKFFTRFTCLLYLCLCTGAALAGDVAAPDKKQELQIAVAPFLPAHLIVKNYQPMREYLETKLKQPVSFITAPDYKTFYERTRQHDYTVIITVAHAAYLAQAEAGYVPMLQPVNLTQPVLIVSNTSKFKHPIDLKNRVIALPDPLAIISMQGVEMLREAGLNPDADFTRKHLPNHGAAVNYVLTGEVAAAIVSNRALLQMSKATQQKVHIIYQSSKWAAPGIFYLANPAMPAERVALLAQTIRQFVKDTPQGRDFIHELGYGDLVPATEHDLQAWAGYGAMFKAVLKQQKE